MRTGSVGGRARQHRCNTAEDTLEPRKLEPNAPDPKTPDDRDSGQSAQGQAQRLFVQASQTSTTALAELLAAFPRNTGKAPLKRAQRARARGLVGAARGNALVQLSLATGRPLICVVADEERADALEKDLRFFAGPQVAESDTDADATTGASATAPSILRIPGDEVLPYEGLTPDRLVGQARMAALFHLHLGAQPKGGPRRPMCSRVTRRLCRWSATAFASHASTTWPDTRMRNRASMWRCAMAMVGP